MGKPHEQLEAWKVAMQLVKPALRLPASRERLPWTIGDQQVIE